MIRSNQRRRRPRASTRPFRLAVVLVAAAGALTAASTPADLISSAPTPPPRTSTAPAQSALGTPDQPVVRWSSAAAPAAAPAPSMGSRPPDSEVRPPTPATTAPLEASLPVRLRVVSIGVDSALVPLGLEADGSLEVPQGASPAGWFTGAPTPGELGPSVLAGHVDWAGEAGVFADLAAVTPGAEVVVDRRDGSTAVFLVTRVDQVDKDSFPTAAVYGDLDHAGLRLITCGGAFSRSAGSYEDNIVVYAELVRTTAT